MVRLIDADELMKTLMHEGLGYQYNRVMCAPTVDAVPVIRCKECWCWDEEEQHGCTHDMGANDFCSRAEREEE